MLAENRFAIKLFTVHNKTCTFLQITKSPFYFSSQKDFMSFNCFCNHDTKSFHIKIQYQITKGTKK